MHSFDFWLQAVEGYLLDTSYGRDAALVEEAMDDSRRESLITTLCNYCVGETTARPVGLTQKMHTPTV